MQLFSDFEALSTIGTGAPTDFEAQSTLYRTDCTRRSKFLMQALSVQKVYIFHSFGF